MPGEAATDETRALMALLDYYRAIGVDCALDETPHDRFAERLAPPVVEESPPPQEPQRREAPSAPIRAPSAAPVFPQEAIRDAEAIAASARTLQELQEGLKGFEGGRASRARHFLFSSGQPASIMELDYAPGEAEESSGEAFSGPEARLLDAMLAAIGQSQNAYRAYFSPWRPAGGQQLTAHVAAALTPFARRHIELARPRAVLLLGDTAKIMLGVSDAPTKLYARRFELQLGEAKVVAIPAPGLAAMLKASSLKRQAWRALRALDEALRG